MSLTNIISNLSPLSWNIISYTYFWQRFTIYPLWRQKKWRQPSVTDPRLWRSSFQEETIYHASSPNSKLNRKLRRHSSADPTAVVSKRTVWVKSPPLSSEIMILWLAWNQQKIVSLCSAEPIKNPLRKPYPYVGFRNGRIFPKHSRWQPTRRSYLERTVSGLNLLISITPCWLLCGIAHRPLYTYTPAGLAAGHVNLRAFVCKTSVFISGRQSLWNNVCLYTLPSERLLEWGPITGEFDRSQITVLHVPIWKIVQIWSDACRMSTTPWWVLVPVPLLQLYSLRFF